MFVNAGIALFLSWHPGPQIHRHGIYVLESLSTDILY